MPKQNQVKKMKVPSKDQNDHHTGSLPLFLSYQYRENCYQNFMLSVFH